MSKSKRAFRSTDRSLPEASYPTLDDFDFDRRRFLGHLGTLFGAGVLGSTLAACGDGRRVQTEADAGVDNGANNQPPEPWPLQGDPAEPDARIDRPDSAPIGRPDSGVPEDSAVPKPDVDWPLEGDVAEPDARIDTPPDWGIGGGMPAPDAAVDTPDMMPSPGIAPAPDAAIDACPNP